MCGKIAAPVFEKSAKLSGSAVSAGSKSMEVYNYRIFFAWYRAI
jgi:hypothetical protein